MLKQQSIFKCSFLNSFIKMVSKKLLSFGIFLGIFFLLTGSVASIECSIKTTCSPAEGKGIIISLSDTENAHGEIGGGNYGTQVCCDFQGTNDFTGNNGLGISLSSPTNAHGELTSAGTSGYSPMGYGGLECVTGADFDSCDESGTTSSGYDLEIVSLLENTNSHFGDFDEYDNKVCCKWEAELYWADKDGVRLEKNEDGVFASRVGNTVQLILKNHGFFGTLETIKDFFTVKNTEAAGFELDRTIKEGVTSGKIDSDNNNVGSAIGIWEIGNEGTEGNLDEFYFSVNGLDNKGPSGYLKIFPLDDTILCSEYPSESECNAFSDQVAKDSSVQVLDVDGTTYNCGETIPDGGGTVACECVWESNACAATAYLLEAFNCGNGIPENSDTHSEECDDGNNVNSDGCSNTCEFDACLTTSGGLCENGGLEGLELCNDGTWGLNCGISDNGILITSNGNSICESGESCASKDCNGEKDSCSDGLVCSITSVKCCNTVSDGNCENGCRIADPDCVEEGGLICGNGIEEFGEQCDDRNTKSDDGCSSTCQLELVDPDEVGECPEGLSLCANDGCSYNCFFNGQIPGCAVVDGGNGNCEGIKCDNDGSCEVGEGCGCNDCAEKERDDSGNRLCETGSTCSKYDLACCGTGPADGVSNPYCAVSDPDNWIIIDYPKPGLCNYINQGEDDCADNFLDYIWTVSWDWGEGNDFSLSEVENNDFSSNINDYEEYLDDEGNTVYSYDPLHLFENCVGGQNVIPCPAQIQLPFFGFFGFIFSLVLVALIYTSLIFRRQKDF